MATSKFFSIATALRVMIFGGLLAILFVIVQSCQAPKTGLDSYAKDSLRKLVVLPSPPVQPDLEFTGPDGAFVRLADFKGQTILLNVWATWCAPCIKEMPTLDALQKQRGGETFQVVAVSLDRTQEEAQLWFEKNGIKNLTAYYDGSFALSANLEARGLPISVLYNTYGAEIARVAGDADWASPEAMALINAVTE